MVIIQRKPQGQHLTSYMPLDFEFCFTDCCHMIDFRINNCWRLCRRDLQVITWSTMIWPTRQSSGFLHTITSMCWIRTPTLLGLRLDPSPTSARIMRGNDTCHVEAEWLSCAALSCLQSQLHCNENFALPFLTTEPSKKTKPQTEETSQICTWWY